MLEHEFTANGSILVLTPTFPLTADDFKKLAAEIDPLIGEKGLAGVMLRSATFPPHWKNLAAIIAHIRFIRAHHRRVKKVALVVPAGRPARFIPKLAIFFLHPEVRHFSQYDEAMNWLTSACP